MDSSSISAIDQDAGDLRVGAANSALEARTKRGVLPSPDSSGLADKAKRSGRGSASGRVGQVHHSVELGLKCGYTIVPLARDGGEHLTLDGGSSFVALWHRA